MYFNKYNIIILASGRASGRKRSSPKPPGINCISSIIAYLYNYVFFVNSLSANRDGQSRMSVLIAVEPFSPELDMFEVGKWFWISAALSITTVTSAKIGAVSKANFPDIGIFSYVRNFHASRVLL